MNFSRALGFLVRTHFVAAALAIGAMATPATADVAAAEQEGEQATHPNKLAYLAKREQEREEYRQRHLELLEQWKSQREESGEEVSAKEGPVSLLAKAGRGPRNMMEYANVTAVNPAIVGGDSAEDFGDPYGWFSHSPGCGAVLVHKDIIATAAHCFGNVFNFGDTVNVGQYDLTTTTDGDEEFTVRFSVPHPYYLFGDNQGVATGWDFMLVALDGLSTKKKIRFNNKFSYPSNGQRLKAIGFGFTDFDGGTSPDTLQEVDVRVVAHKECLDLWGGISIINREVHLCAGGFGGTGICQGDSGGPLLDQDDRLVGISSYTGSTCGEGRPDVFFRVSSASDWMLESICGMSAEPPLRCCLDKLKESSCGCSLFLNGSPCFQTLVETECGYLLGETKYRRVRRRYRDYCNSA